MEEQQSTIVTFYSYKGGVGRSMALANVGWLLAEKFGKKVLVVDWDLEAPGLHKYFDLEEARLKKGLIDLLLDYKTLVGKETSLPDELFDLNDYVNPIASFPNNGSISLLAAGLQNQQYKTHVNEFNWEEFYTKWRGFGFIEYFKKKLKQSSDIVLIDSRTGVTDIGGICTLQLPEVVVLMFAFNKQNLKGIESVVETILERAPEVAESKAPPKLMLRPSRVEILSEQVLLNKWQATAARILGRFLPASEQREALKVLHANSIPYVGFYSFGEIPLAVRSAPQQVLAESFSNLATDILDAAAHPGQAKIASRGKLYGWYLQARDRLRYFSISGQTWVALGVFLLILAGGAWAYYSKARQAKQLTQDLELRARELTHAREEADQELKKLQEDLRKLASVLTSEIIISDLRVGDFNCGEVTIEWTTNKASSSQVNFGTTVTFGTTHKYEKTNTRPTMTTTHSVTLQDLIGGAEYHYQVQSADAKGNNTISDDATFTMPPRVLMFIHSSDSQQAPADRIHDALMGQYDVCDVKIDRAPTAIDRLQVRFFSPESKPEAEKLLGILRAYPGLSDATLLPLGPSDGDPGLVFDVYFNGSQP